MGTKRALRYAASWLSRSADVRVAHVELLRDGVPIPARIVHPDRSRSALPAWILLHGITRPGFDHPQLTRFSRALAATGAVVLIPEISEWRDLELAPEAAVPTVDAALESLASLPDLSEGPYGLMGFSFGGPQALVASADERLAGRLAGVVSFGGYCSLERTIRFQLTGAHEWQGRTQHLRPDPYGRWIIGSNHLTAIPNHADAHDVADSLRRLAATAGDSQVPSWEPVWDELKEQLRSRLPPTTGIFSTCSLHRRPAIRTRLRPPASWILSRPPLGVATPSWIRRLGWVSSANGSRFFTGARIA